MNAARPIADAETLARRARRLLGRGRLGAALRLIDRAFAAPGVGATTLRAAIEALHAQAPSAAATDWRRIAAVYDHLAEVEPSREVERARQRAHRRAATLVPSHGASPR